MSATTRFQSWLTKTRTKAQLTYAELAKKSGVSSGAIHSIEHGSGSPSLDTADKLCAALGVRLSDAVAVKGAKGRFVAAIDPGTVPVINNHSDAAADA